MTEIVWQCRAFGRLTPRKLYDVLRLRQDIFSIEQNCHYADLDGYDPHTLHLMGHAGEKLAVYARLFPPGSVYHGEKVKEAIIGRVAAHPDFRGKGLGHLLMKEALAELEKTFGKTAIILNAQARLKDFYGAHGFTVSGPEYLEDGQPHIPMHRAAA
jgi:ElaA protein